MQISARNHRPGVVKSVTCGGVTIGAVVDVGGHDVVWLITRTSADRMRLREGGEVTVIIKATDEMLGAQTPSP